MNPATLLFVTMIGNLVLKYGPELAFQWIELAHKETVSLADWTTLFAGVKTKEQLLSEAQARVLPSA